MSALVLLGARIRAQRQELGWSQEKLAEMCGLNRSAISPIELGKRNLGVETLLSLAKNLETTASELLEKIEHGG